MEENARQSREILIAQAKVDAPDYPRDQEWWTGFVPCWVTAEVRADGIVSLTYNGRTFDGEPPKLSAVEARHGFQVMERWLMRLKRLAVAVIGDQADVVTVRAGAAED